MESMNPSKVKPRVQVYPVCSKSSALFFPKSQCYNQQNFSVAKQVTVNVAKGLFLSMASPKGKMV